MKANALLSYLQIRTGFDEELDRMRDTLNDLPEILRGVGQVITAIKYTRSYSRCVVALLTRS